MFQDLVESFSGIRGIYGKSITEEFAKNYIFCYCNLFGDKISKLVVGGDTRPSTDNLKQAILQALGHCGVKQVIDVGTVPIQVATYAVQKFQAQGAAYISASHNEPEYNGWKLLKEDGAILYADQAEKLIAMVHSFQGRPLKKPAVTFEIIDKQEEAVRAYIEFVLEIVGRDALKKIKKSRLKILADPNGGAGINVLAKLFQALGVTYEIVNDELGKFSRLIEPKAESLAPLAEKMRREQFDFACGFDCDSDRVEFVLSPESDFAKRMGTPIVSGHYILALACDAALRGTENQVVVVNDATSYLVRDVILKYKAIIKEVEVGETNVVSEMEKNNGLIGGEGSCSGVIIFPLKCRDGIMSVALILKMLAERGKSLSEILEDYPQYYSDRTKLQCPPDRAIAIREKIEQYFGGQGCKIQKTGDETGGLKVLVDKNSFIFFRQSKTEPGIFRIHTEGDGSREKVQKMLQQGIAIFNQLKN